MSKVTNCTPDLTTIDILNLQIVPLDNAPTFLETTFLEKQSTHLKKGGGTESVDNASSSASNPGGAFFNMSGLCFSNPNHNKISIFPWMAQPAWPCPNLPGNLSSMVCTRPQWAPRSLSIFEYRMSSDGSLGREMNRCIFSHKIS